MTDIRVFNVRDDLQNIHLRDGFSVLGLVSMPNGCCMNKLVAITAEPCETDEDRPDGVSYVCQCMCGQWHTAGYATPGKAVDAYVDMTNAYLNS